MLPQIIAEVLSEEHIVLTVNGQAMPATPTTRSQLGHAIGEIVTRLGTPTRVEVHELDGSVYADIITPTASPSPPTSQPPRATPVLLEFTADGFVPGEDVAIAFILRHASAAGSGRVRALIDRAEHAEVAGEVILVGRISGTVSIQSID